MAIKYNILADVLREKLTDLFFLFTGGGGLKAGGRGFDTGGRECQGGLPCGGGKAGDTFL